MQMIRDFFSSFLLVELFKGLRLTGNVSVPLKVLAPTLHPQTTRSLLRIPRAEIVMDHVELPTLRRVSVQHRLHGIPRL